MATKGNDIKWFQKQRDHILHRPDMYIGACSVQDSEEWIYDSEDKEMYFKSVKYTPGLLKIFNETLDNARDASINDKTVTQIKVTIDKESGKISVWNNGAGIEVKIHEEYKLYNQEIIFGKLNSGANYNDDKERLAGGTNGLGIKLTNVFSTQFGVDCADGSKKFTQMYKKNMETKTVAKATSSKVKPYVKIIFIPDWHRFGFDSMTDDMYDLFATSVIHTAATTDKRVSVFFNEKSVGVKDFEKFLDLYIGSDKKKTPRVFYSDPNGRWQVGLSISDSYEHESFVNGIHTRDGGTHVKYITAQIIKGVKELLAKKKETKGAKINNSYIEQNLFVFVSCIINQPSFNSQTKNALNTKSSLFGSTCNLPDKFIDDFVKKTDIVSRVAGIANVKENKELDKTSGKKKSKINVEKLEDANWAGTSKSDECTLFVVEGDSAKSFAMSGFSVIGRDKYGVFPLRGKLLNVRDASRSSLSKNKEIGSLLKILGLQYGEKYSEGTTKLRYGRICTLCDSDVDGFHIKGLVINFINKFWPELFKHEFVWTFNTPVVKVTKGTGKNKQVNVFYTMPEYGNWIKTLNGKNIKNWYIKYYKGLGTSKASEAKEYFKELSDKMTLYTPDKNSQAFINLAFQKDKADSRKTWIQGYDKEKQLIKELPKKIGLSEFIHKELILFSVEDNERSLPNLVDGLKPSQRKIIWFALNEPGFSNSRNEMKVVAYAGALIKDMAYHHGDVSASETIVSLAQDYVGSGNNINLLMPEGGFGTRMTGGKDHASSRYINTYLNPVSRVIFDKNDDPLLELLEDDGKLIEPEYLAPIIPMVLVNSSGGIGTGFSSNIPCYNIDDIKANLVRLMKGTDMVEMVPWHKGFSGTIRKKENGNFESVGIFKKINEKTIVISELPVGRWTETYKDFLAKKEENNELTFTEGNTDVNVEFTIKMKKPLEDDKIVNYLGLVSKGHELKSLSTSNMYLWNAKGKIQKYDSPLDIIQEFYDVRLDMYEKRKKHLCSVLRKECELLTEKARFIRMVSEEEIIVFKQKRSVIVDQLKKHDFKLVDALLDLKIHLFTDEKIRELNEQCKCKQEEFERVDGISVKVMWATDLGNL